MQTDNICTLFGKYKLQFVRPLETGRKTGELFCSETSIVIIVFDGVLCEVHDYTVTISYRRSTSIRYQKNDIFVSDPR